MLRQFLPNFASTVGTNGYGSAEIGLSSGFERLFDGDLLGYSIDNRSVPAKPRYKGLEEAEVMQMLLWQSTSMKSVSSPLPDLEAEHLDLGNKIMPAIGIRCTSASVAGNAKINGLAGNFTDFVRLDPVSSYIEDVPRFSHGVHVMLLPGNMSTLPFDLYQWPDSEAILLDLSASVNHTID